MFIRALRPISLFFRRRRNRALVTLIEGLYRSKNAPVEVLDIGGSLYFWLSIPAPVRAMCRIRLINLPRAYEETLSPAELALKDSVEMLTGDARDLSRFADQQFDLAVCNSVIEHVGTWADMTRAAGEVQRVGVRGWVQVPAFEFPIEQHYLLPLVHWFADPIQVGLLRRVHRFMRGLNTYDRFEIVQHTRPMTRGQLRELFSRAAAIRSEWLVFPKSHIASW